MNPANELSLALIGEMLRRRKMVVKSEETEMARRQKRRVGPIPELSPENDDIQLNGLTLEMALSKGALTGRLKDFPLSAVVRADLEELLDVKISDVAWYEIETSTARYMLSATQFKLGLSAPAVQNVCRDLIRAIGHLKATYDQAALDHPRVAAFLEDRLGIGSTVRHLADFDSAMLSREIEHCAAEPHVADGSAWDKWVRDLAKICPELGIMPSGEGPDRSGSKKISKFVMLLRELQTRVPEMFAEHQKNSESSDASFARAVRRALARQTSE